MLHDAHCTAAPRSARVSMSTPVWIVICKEPEMRTPAKGFLAPNSFRQFIRPGISCSARVNSFRPNSANPMSLTFDSATLIGPTADVPKLPGMITFAPPFSTTTPEIKGAALATHSNKKPRCSAENANFFFDAPDLPIALFACEFVSKVFSAFVRSSSTGFSMIPIPTSISARKALRFTRSDVINSSIRITGAFPNSSLLSCSVLHASKPLSHAPTRRATPKQSMDPSGRSLATALNFSAIVPTTMPGPFSFHILFFPAMTCSGTPACSRLSKLSATLSSARYIKHGRHEGKAV
mmetsp:Transcript_153167/g.266986  ORF Transcript_153167/g.266986 Transcript_153167/m.266986 type:complete len:294 (-) Transcript_153167:277-1158(-)